MRCGNCKGEHARIAQVKHCYATNEGQPSGRQMSLAQALASERVRLEEYDELSQLDYELMIAGLGRKAISEFIGKMLKQQHSGVSRDELFSRVENGKYALKNIDDDDIRFYMISGGRNRVLWELTGAPGSFRQTRMHRPEKVLQRISFDPMAAYVLFGLNVGECGRCGSPLTKKHTREQGMGDTCKAKMEGKR